MSPVIVPDGLTTITYDVRDYVAQVTLNRPEVHNAFNERMQDELAAVWRHIRLDDAVRVVVLTGAGVSSIWHRHDRGEFRPTKSSIPSPTTIPAKRSARRVRDSGSPSLPQSTAWPAAEGSTSSARVTSSSPQKRHVL